MAGIIPGLNLGSAWARMFGSRNAAHTRSRAAGMSADMQPWGGTLSEDEIRNLIKFDRSFCQQPATGGTQK